MDDDQNLAARKRTRVIYLADGSVGWFHGGSRPNKQPGMSYASMKRWLLLPARKRPPIGADGQPIPKGKWRSLPSSV